jgi:hypothetical protein
MCSQCVCQPQWQVFRKSLVQESQESITDLGQHITKVLDWLMMLVLAVVNASGHMIGPTLRNVFVLLYWAALCSHQVVTGGGRQEMALSTEIPYPGSYATSEPLTNSQNSFAQGLDVGQAEVKATMMLSCLHLSLVYTSLYLE